MKCVQCCELFRGIALKNHAFFYCRLGYNEHVLYALLKTSVFTKVVDFLAYHLSLHTLHRPMLLTFLVCET